MTDEALIYINPPAPLIAALQQPFSCTRNSLICQYCSGAVLGDGSLCRNQHDILIVNCPPPAPLPFPPPPTHSSASTNPLRSCHIELIAWLLFCVQVRLAYYFTSITQLGILGQSSATSAQRLEYLPLDLCHHQMMDLKVPSASSRGARTRNFFLLLAQVKHRILLFWDMAEAGRGVNNRSTFFTADNTPGQSLEFSLW